MEYVALRPVQFDRGYKIGEAIPAKVIALGSVKRLMDSGRIAPATSAQGAMVYESAAAAAFEYLVAFMEVQLGVKYEGDEKESLTVHDRAEICKDGLAAFMEAFAQMEGAGIAVGVPDTGDDEAPEPLHRRQPPAAEPAAALRPVDDLRPLRCPRLRLPGGEAL